MKAIIIEDEPIIAKVLQSKLQKMAPDVEVLASLSSLKTARRWLSEHAEPDMIFMDVQLSDGVSFELFDDFTLQCPIVFTTAYDKYALKAFRVNGVDYLLKPINDAELEAAINKCKRLLDHKQRPPTDITALVQALSNPGGAPRYKEKFIVQLRQQWIPINTKDIACFSKQVLNYIYLHNGDRYVVDFVTLDEVEELLDPNQFYRANRQFIINIDALKSVKPIENSKLLLTLKEPNHKLDIDLSRVKSPEFKKWMDR
jgi:DNA-binding LytR/AlgR family response regulator